MKNLLKFQFKKLITNIYTYIILAIQVAIVLVLAIAKRNMPDYVPGSITGVSYMLSAISQGLTLYAIAVFVSIFASEDKSNDVVKNIYARGYTPTQTLASELIAVCFFTIASCAVNWVAAFAFGSELFGGAGSAPSSVGGQMFAQLLVAIAYTCLFYMISRLIVKPAGVTAVNILAPIALNLVFTGLDSMLSKSSIVVTPYSPDGLLKSVSVLSSTSSLIGTAIALALVYAAAFTVVSVLVNRKRPA